MSPEAATPAPRVPFRTLEPTNAPVREAILREVSDLLGGDELLEGGQVARFEEAFARWVGTRECVGTSSGTDALRLSLIAAGLGPGAEVIAPANSFIATYAAIVQAGARPVLVDVTEADYDIDVAAAAAAVTERTRAIMPVHLYGLMADMRALRELAARHDLVIVEDAAQAHGAERDGLRAGASGLAAGFSFWPGKNLGAIGDAGAITTDDLGLAERARAVRNHGQLTKHSYDLPGYTARLDAVQAIALFHKLPLLEAWNARRSEIAAAYDEALAGVGDLALPPVAPGSTPVWHLYPLLTARRDAIVASFEERGVRTGRHAPQPPHHSAEYAFLGYPRDAFPLTERLARDSLLLPIFPGMTDEQVARVIEAVRAAFA